VLQQNVSIAKIPLKCLPKPKFPRRHWEAALLRQMTGMAQGSAGSTSGAGLMRDVLFFQSSRYR
jgi:hypothetical protein